MECGGMNYIYEIVPTRCEECRGLGFKLHNISIRHIKFDY